MWLAMAGVALSVVQIALWRTRRVLNGARRGPLMTDSQLVTPALLAPPAFVLPAAATEMASSVLAS